MSPTDPAIDPAIDPAAEPSGAGCAECLAGSIPGWWVHLRRCATCGHIGCCDTSPSRHASSHAAIAGHPVLRSFEPGESWFYNVLTEKYFVGPTLADPQSRPSDQPVPAPADKVPENWRDYIHPG
ncbi:hypothetical protein ABIB15_001902 [Marisediminicola sp. UYEF4]|uniref:UBP-type zinc finger domain-containing protein n=1 Tax=Marisediminicola sp. UYEF4 TaxID=1756384 RepID=UPI003397589D